MCLGGVVGINFAQKVELHLSFFSINTLLTTKSNKSLHISSNQPNQQSRCSGSVCWLPIGIALLAIAILTNLVDDAQNDYNKAKDSENTASLGHEALSGGAAFLAMHEFEKHQRENGKLDVQNRILLSHISLH
jgi:hypothetical protein